MVTVLMERGAGRSWGAGSAAVSLPLPLPQPARSAAAINTSFAHPASQQFVSHAIPPLPLWHSRRGLAIDQGNYIGSLRDAKGGGCAEMPGGMEWWVL